MIARSVCSFQGGVGVRCFVCIQGWLATMWMPEAVLSGGALHFTNDVLEIRASWGWCLDCLVMSWTALLLVHAFQFILPCLDRAWGRAVVLFSNDSLPLAFTAATHFNQASTGCHWRCHDRASGRGVVLFSTASLRLADRCRHLLGILRDFRSTSALARVGLSFKSLFNGVRQDPTGFVADPPFSQP